MDNPTLKKHIATMLSISATLPELDKNNIILMTAAGIISGKLPSKTDDDPKHFFQKLVLQMKDEHAKTYQVSGNDGYIPLIDVTVSHGGRVEKFDCLIVFIDQIIGITIGQVDAV